MTKNLSDLSEQLIEFNGRYSNGRYSGALVMADPEGELTIVERPSNPCYGYLRKYKSTHGEEATQPEGKPGDLNHPFPEGEPVALAIAFTVNQNDLPLLDFIWGPQSPWINGFGSPDNVVRTYKNNKITGVILSNTDVDPTVMVNLFKFTKCTLSMCSNKFNALIGEGLSEFEALVCVTLDAHGGYYPSGANTYMFPTKANIKGMKEGKTNDFSNGTFRKRFDYSRKNIQDIFADKKDGIVFALEMNKMAQAKSIKLIGKADDLKPYAELAKEIIRKYI